MRSLLLLCAIVLVFGVSCASTTTGQERPSMNVDSSLILEGYDLIPFLGSQKPIGDHIYLIAKSGKIEITIRTVEEFSQVIRELASEEDALEFVRLLTAQNIRPYLKDVYYAEVHKQTDNDDKWFAIEAAQYDDWELHEPVVTEENGLYKIERYVATYPRYLAGRPVTDAQLLKIREWVTPAGEYALDIREIVAEGDDIYKILVFTK